MVLDIFNTMLAQGILSIPIPARPCPNKLMWIPGSKGLFSVKSAYKELLSSTSSRATTEVNWSKLWKIKRLEESKYSSRELPPMHSSQQKI